MFTYPLTLAFERFSGGRKIHILDAALQPRLFVKQRALALKEVVHVSTDDLEQQKLYQIKADRILDFAADYTIQTANGAIIGQAHRQGMRSRWRALYNTIQIYRKTGWNTQQISDLWNVTYTITDIEGNEIGQILEQMPLLKLIGTIFAELLLIRPFLNPTYYITLHGQPVLVARKQSAMFSRTFTLMKKGDFSELDERLLLNSVIVALLIERSLGI